MSQQFPLLLLFVLAFLLLVVLPGRQRKKMAARTQAMQEALTPGTPVLTTAGLHATVVDVGATTVDLQIAPGVVSTFERRAILEVRAPADEPGPQQPGGVVPQPPADGDGAPGGGATAPGH